MNSVKVDRKQLLYIVRENQKKHVIEYLDAVEDYKAAVIKLCKQNMKLAKSEDVEVLKQIKHFPEKPLSYESNYTRAIRMLELSVEDVIEIEEYLFNQLVLDEWDWKQRFANLSASYKSF